MNQTTTRTKRRRPGQALRLNRSYSDEGFMVRPSPDADSHHWQGGPCMHQGATCPECQQPLMLIWDLDLGGPEFVGLPGRLFEGGGRLPLYYCFCHLTTLSYQLVDPERIKVLETPDPDPRQAPPYDNYPERFDRRPIALVPIPATINNLLLLMQEIDSEEWVHDSDLSALASWLGRDVEDRPDMWRHQIGGAPYLLGGHEELLCPNLSCELSRPWVRNEIRFAMKELAVIHNDPRNGLPLWDPPSVLDEGRDVDHWVQLVYHVCEECLTLRVGLRRD